jgi:signal transduction histidine kinase
VDWVHGVEKEMMDGAQPAAYFLCQKKEPLNGIHSVFVQNVSHELRTPLTILYGYAEMLSNGDMGELTAEQQYAATIITDRARVLGTLIERIEVLLAIEASKTTLLPLAFAEVVAEALDGKCLHAARAGVTLEVRLDPNVPFVWGDSQQLRQATACLVENALKFTPNGGWVSVHVYAEPERVCLAVSDSGIGMTPQELEHVLDGFYQADSSATRRYGGLGLGLTVVKAVVAEHGGTIQIESQPGRGSRFVISFPAMQADSLENSNLPQAARWLP